MVCIRNYNQSPHKMELFFFHMWALPVHIFKLFQGYIKPDKQSILRILLYFCTKLAYLSLAFQQQFLLEHNFFYIQFNHRMVFVQVYIKAYWVNDKAIFYMANSLFYMKFSMNLYHNVLVNRHGVDMVHVFKLLYCMVYNHDDWLFLL